MKNFKDLIFKQSTELLERLNEISCRNDVKNGTRYGKSKGQIVASYVQS